MSDLAFDVIGMNWWLMETPLEGRQGREKLIELMERELPNCLPYSYGKFGPDYKYDQFGKEHFLRFLEENPEWSIWRARRPILSINLNLPKPPGPRSVGKQFDGFRMNHLSIHFEKGILDAANWAAKLMKFWKAVSRDIKPVYGDIRNLGPHRWQGEEIACLAGSKAVGWWWKGIPRTLGKAVVLGTAYQNLWSSFTSISEMKDGLAFASLPDWRSDSDLSELVGPPPEDQVVVILPRGHLGTPGPFPKFPKGWPFGNPFPD
jgi:hypothetical protein